MATRRRNADNLERGPVRVRNALQFSLNIPSVKAMALNGPDHVFDRAKDFGMTFQRETTDAGLALALGVAETRPVDLATAYGTLANSGRRIGHTTILTVTRPRRATTPSTRTSRRRASRSSASRRRSSSPTSCAGTRSAAVNPFWGRFQIRDANGDYRPATLKTGTNNDAKDLNAYGYIAPPTEEGRADGAYALVVGVWNGNSDNTPVSTPERRSSPSTSRPTSGTASCSEVSADWPITEFEAPGGLTRATIDPFTGFLSSGGGDVEEWFIAGHRADRPLWRADVCGERRRSSPWASRTATTTGWAPTATGSGAPSGPGHARRPREHADAYFYNNGFNPYGRTWGALVAGGGCGQPSPTPTCFPVPTPGRERRRPVVRGPVAVGRRARRPALPTAVIIGQRFPLDIGHADRHTTADRDAH